MFCHSYYLACGSIYPTHPALAPIAQRDKSEEQEASIYQPSDSSSYHSHQKAQKNRSSLSRIRWWLFLGADSQRLCFCLEICRSNESVLTTIRWIQSGDMLKLYSSRGNSSVVERHLPKVNVVGSSPISRFFTVIFVVHFIDILSVLHNYCPKFPHPLVERILVLWWKSDRLARSKISVLIGFCHKIIYFR